MTLSLDGLDLLNAPAILTAGAPLQLPLDLIDEDPDQPRKDFDPVPLAELTDSVKARGVLQAISVRRHPLTPDRWMVNFGARRLRASRLAGKPTIPAYVDNAMDSYDQVIENARLPDVHRCPDRPARLAAGSVPQWAVPWYQRALRTAQAARVAARGRRAMDRGQGACLAGRCASVQGAAGPRRTG
jgi:ParB family chromosome partitioning protein